MVFKLDDFFTSLYNVIAKTINSNIRFYKYRESLPSNAFIYQLKNRFRGNKKRLIELEAEIIQLKNQIHFYSEQSDRNFSRYQRARKKQQETEEKLNKLKTDYAELQGSLRSKNTPLTDTRTSLEILGLKAPFTQLTLKNTYVRLANRYHPDQHSQMSEAFIKEAEVEFIKIKQAYESLSKN